MNILKILYLKAMSKNCNTNKDFKEFKTMILLYCVESVKMSI